MNNHQTCSSQLGIVTISEKTYALHQCNMERLWVSFNENDVPIYEATLDQVKRMLWGKPCGLMERTLREAYKLFILLPR